jgi:uncharacterized integral membrane protein (TIGR00698 family)
MYWGIGFAVIIAIIALLFSNLTSINATILAIVFGLLVANYKKIPNKFNSGISYSEKTILAFAIATMGIFLDFSILLELGLTTLMLMVSSIFITIFSAIYIGRFFKIESKLGLLLGIGNGICGASAIGATKNIIKSKDDEVGISIAVINFLGTVGMFLVPFIAIGIGLNERESGILIGNTLQAVGQAVAGGFSVGEVSGQNATVVKMGRVLLLTPIMIILVLIYTEKSINSDTTQSAIKINIFRNIPIFILFFIFFSMLATFKILPADIETFIGNLSYYSLLIAMAAIGLKISFSSIKENGKKALLVGSLIFLVQIIFSLSFILLFII